MKINIFLFQRDLRLSDNRALFEALNSGNPVLPVYCWPEEDFYSNSLGSKRRIAFIQFHINLLNKSLEKFGAKIQTYSRPLAEVLKDFSKDFTIEAIYSNEVYEPQEKKQQQEIKESAQKLNIRLFTFKDDVIFEKSEILKPDQKPYTVFTPYSKKWLAAFTEKEIRHNDSENLLQNLCKSAALNLQEPEQALVDFELLPKQFQLPELNITKIQKYHETRDFPALEATSLLSTHLRYGTLSIRKAVSFALEHNKIWLNELIWREFFKMILWHFPDVVNYSFKKKYDNIPWRNNETEFEAWRTGQTGYPMVDAGMRELNTTGFMHNRVRMVVASFLTKHLLIDWRWGEAYFAEQLLDYELSANNGNWQWAAGSGCDAAPYFRVFNPTNQQQKFDPKLQYIVKWVPEAGTMAYVQPLVEHDFARKRAIETYKNALNE